MDSPPTTIVHAPAGNARAATLGTGIAAASTTIIVWLIGLFGVDVPAEVAVAISTVIGGVVAYRAG